MQQRKKLVVGCGLVLIASANAANAITIDGTLDPGAYGSILTHQTITSNTGDVNGASPRTNAQNQLSNAYGVIDTTNNQLDIFIGGALNLDNEYFHLLIDANPTTGVANLTPGVHTPATTGDSGIVPAMLNASNPNNNITQTTFDAGFRPETLLTFQFGGGSEIFDNNLTTGVDNQLSHGDPAGGAKTFGPAVGDPIGSVDGTVAVDNSLSSTLETAATSASATTGFEIQLSLSELGYVPGSNVGVMAFISQGTASTVTNQVLAPDPNDATDPYFQYNFNFAGTDPNHPADGNQYFVIPAASATPEPTSIALLGLAAAPMIFGRRRKQHATAE